MLAIVAALLLPSAPPAQVAACLKDPAAERRRLACAPLGQTQTSTVPRGRIDPNAIYKVIAATVDELLACVEKEQSKSPPDTLRVVVDFEIDRDGSVRWACLNGAPAGETCLASCILELTKKMRFAKPEGGPVRISYPYLLDLAKQD